MKEARVSSNRNNDETNIKFYRYYRLKIKNIIQLRSINEAIRITNTVALKRECTKLKYKYKFSFLYRGLEYFY